MSKAVSVSLDVARHSSSWEQRADSLDFTAIDFETANGSRASACAVALVRVRGGQVVEQIDSLIRPEDGGGFSGFNIRIHGIRPSHVVSAPTWAQLWPVVAEFVGSDALLAHNAPFDRGVWRAVCQLAGIGATEPQFHCTVRLSRRFLPLPSHRLPAVVQALNLPDFRHHEAAADALACAQIGIELARRAGLRTIADFGAPLGPGRR